MFYGYNNNPVCTYEYTLSIHRRNSQEIYKIWVDVKKKSIWNDFPKKTTKHRIKKVPPQPGLFIWMFFFCCWCCPVGVPFARVRICTYKFTIPGKENCLQRGKLIIHILFCACAKDNHLHPYFSSPWIKREEKCVIKMTNTTTLIALKRKRWHLFFYTRIK